MTGDSPDDETGRGRPKVEVLQLAAGALASITAALLGSRLGVNGTIIGAALGSIVGTVASATYTEFLDRTAARVRTVVGAPAETPAPQPPMAVGTIQVDPAPPTVPHHHAAAHWQPPAAPRVDTDAVTDARLRVPWRGVVIAVLATFLVVVGVLTAFELLSGRTVSSFTGGGTEGGTSIGHVLDPAPEVSPTADLPSPDPTATVATSLPPSEAPTTDEPSSTAPTTSSPTTAPSTSPPSDTSTPTSS